MKNKDLISLLQTMPPEAETYIEMIDGCAALNTVEHYQVGEGSDAPQVIVLHTPHFYKFVKSTGWCD